MANTGILTNKHSVEVADLFYNSVLSSNSSYFVFAGKHTPWDDDNTPPPAGDSLLQTQISVFSDVLYGKQVANTNIRRLVPRYNWTSNTLYANYDPTNTLLYSNNFFVINSSNSVYKVLDNNDGAYSTVEPAVVSTDIFRTTDGYTWKYMYTVPSTDMSSFASNNYIPVVPNTAVQDAAVSGGIDVIRVLDAGTGWATYNTGILQGVINAYAVTISSNSSSNNNFYTNSSIYLKSGLGSNQLKKIASYNGSSKIATLYSPLDYYVNLTLANNAGVFAKGDIVSQSVSYLIVTSKSGYYQPGDVLEQYINDTATATGVIVTTGDNTFKVRKTSTQAFLSDYPARVVDRGTTLQTGTITVANNSNTVTGTSTNFVTEYNVGDYLKIDTAAKYYRISEIANTTSLTIAGPSANAFTSNIHYKINSGLTVSSVTNISANGEIVFVDLDTVKLNVNNFVGNFIAGEVIVQSNSSTNGVISFSNNSTLIITNVDGPGFQSSNSTVNFLISGVSSGITANVTAVVNLPTITLESTYRDFTVGINATSSSGGSAIVAGIATIPDEQTEYVISPTVNIDGDGSNAAAYSIVNTTIGTITSVIVIDPGTNYVHPNSVYNSTTVTLEANSLYGAGANLQPVVGPPLGHGADPFTELGARYVGLSVEFGNTYNESYNYPTPSTFRRVGMLKNPLWDNVYLTITDYDRVKLSVSNASNTCTEGEVVYQPSTNAAGIVVYANTTFIELEKVKGTFVDTGSNNNIYALYSDTTANIDLASVSTFSTTSNVQTIVQQTTNAQGTLVTANNTTLTLTNVRGTFANGYTVYDSSTNSYATVTAMKLHNNGKATTFNKFNNTMRLTLSSNTIPYTNNEVVLFKTPVLNTSFAQALVLSNIGESDLLISSPTTTFNQYETVTLGTANGVVLFANSTYLKLTQVRGTLANTANVVAATSGAQANVVTVYPALILSDVEGTVSVSSCNYIFGVDSGANGYCAIANTITYPELVRDSGSTLYIENISPITKSSTSKEAVKLVIKF